MDTIAELAMESSKTQPMWPIVGPNRPVIGPAGFAMCLTMEKAEITRLRELKEARGLTSAELVRLADIEPSTLSKIEIGRRGLTRNFAPRLAEALRVPVSELYAPVGAPIPQRSASATQTGSIALQGSAGAQNGLPSFGGFPRDVPVFGTMSSSQDGVFSVNKLAGPVGWAVRGPGIAGMPQVYAIYVDGDTMTPWRNPGSLAYVHESRPAAPGCHVVVELQEGPDEAPSSILKGFVRRTESELELRQYNPADTVRLDRAKVRRVLRVLEWEEILGV